jgi:hypothetical protein
MPVLFSHAPRIPHKPHTDEIEDTMQLTGCSPFVSWTTNSSPKSQNILENTLQVSGFVLKHYALMNRGSNNLR